MPADLVGGSYATEDQIWKFFGRPRNATQQNIAARSNIWAFGYGAPLDSATAATKKGVFAAIPVQEGDVISKVSCLIGATEGKTGVKSFVALYSGTTAKKEAVLQAQSKVKEVAIKPKLILTEELESSVLITSANAPNGYVFAGLIVEATTINTQIGTKVVAAAQKAWFATGPEAFAVEAEQKEAGVAAATIKTETAVELVPYIFLQ
jgi:hypothetical protein